MNEGRWGDVGRYVGDGGHRCTPPLTSEVEDGRQGVAAGNAGPQAVDAFVGVEAEHVAKGHAAHPEACREGTAGGRAGGTGGWAAVEE